ncbi:hypothetical protein Tco_1329350 [Tanacetum coccineum]
MGSFHLHANKVLFEREQKPRAYSNDKRLGVFRAHVPTATKSGNKTGNFASILKEGKDYKDKKKQKRSKTDKERKRQEQE